MRALIAAMSAALTARDALISPGSQPIEANAPEAAPLTVPSVMRALALGDGRKRDDDFLAGVIDHWRSERGVGSVHHGDTSHAGDRRVELEDQHEARNNARLNRQRQCVERERWRDRQIDIAEPAVGTPRFH